MKKIYEIIIINMGGCVGEVYLLDKLFFYVVVLLGVKKENIINLE